MSWQNESQKDCGPQPFPGAKLSHATPLEQLGVLAQEVHAELIAGERAATPGYWRLGQILSLAKKQVERGRWADYLASLKIEKTRASKSRAIFRTYSSPKQLEGLSVSEAYEQRVRTARKEKTTPDVLRRSDPVPFKAALPRWIYTLIDDAQRLRDEVEFLTETEVTTVLKTVGGAEQLLRELKVLLQRRADVAGTVRSE